MACKSVVAKTRSDTMSIYNWKDQLTYLSIKIVSKFGVLSQEQTRDAQER